jgi:hypothetical protein
MKKVRMGIINEYWWFPRWDYMNHKFLLDKFLFMLIHASKNKVSYNNILNITALSFLEEDEFII